MKIERERGRKRSQQEVLRLRVSGNFSIAAVMILLDWFYFLVSKTPNDSCMFFRISVGEIVSTNDIFKGNLVKNTSGNHF